MTLILFLCTQNVFNPGIPARETEPILPRLLKKIRRKINSLLKQFEGYSTYKCNTSHIWVSAAPELDALHFPWLVSQNRCIWGVSWFPLMMNQFFQTGRPLFVGFQTGHTPYLQWMSTDRSKILDTKWTMVSRWHLRISVLCIIIWLLVWSGLKTWVYIEEIKVYRTPEIVDILHYNNCKYVSSCAYNTWEKVIWSTQTTFSGYFVYLFNPSMK